MSPVAVPRFQPGLLLGLLLTLFLFSACSQQPVTPSRQEAQVRAQLLGFYAQWKGTPHALGRQDRRGIDCSGLTQLAYKQLMDIDLPRTAAGQRAFASPVKKTRLQAGDLVFFSRRVPDHVGIALGDGRFLHVSSKKGVSIAPLNQGYWKDLLVRGGRVP